jgi:hypothetical protein
MVWLLCLFPFVAQIKFEIRSQTLGPSFKLSLRFLLFRFNLVYLFKIDWNSLFSYFIMYYYYFINYILY